MNATSLTIVRGARTPIPGTCLQRGYVYPLGLHVTREMCSDSNEEASGRKHLGCLRRGGNMF